MSDLKFIIDRLSLSPFHLKLTLLSLDEKTGLQLLQLINDVLAYLDGVHARDVREEKKEQMGGRMGSFLGLLGYRKMEDEQTRELLMAGNKNVCFAVLYYLLSKLPELKLRAYLGRFLTDVPIPEEYLTDESISESINSLKLIQADFKETHKNVEKLRNIKVNPNELSKELDTLENEKEQLKVKLSKFQSRIKSDADQAHFQKILAVTSALRKEQEEEHNLMEKQRDQSSQLYAASQNLISLQRRLDDFQSFDLINGDPSSMLEKLRSDLAANRYYLEQKLPIEIDEKSKQSQELESMLSTEPLSEEQLESLEATIQARENRIEQLKTEQQRLASNSKENLAFYATPAAKIAKQKEKLERELVEDEEEKNNLEVELRELDRQIAQYQSILSIRNDNEGSQSTLAAKAEKYKSYKMILQDISNECAVLIRTEEVLKSRNTKQKEFLEEMERKKGVQGYSDTQATLANLASTKQRIDQSKEKTLEEISRLVTDIQIQINSKREKLSPIVQDLRKLRQHFSEVEAVYLENKHLYDNISVGLESECAKIRQDLETNSAGLIQEESRYHLLNAQLASKSDSLTRLTRENQYLTTSARLNKAFKSYSDMFEKKIIEQETVLKELRTKQGDMRGSHSNNVQQREKFKDLLNLMQLKFESAKNQAKEFASEKQEHNFMKLDEDGEN